METFEECKLPFGVAVWDIFGFKTESISSKLSSYLVLRSRTIFFGRHVQYCVPISLHRLDLLLICIYFNTQADH